MSGITPKIIQLGDQASRAQLQTLAASWQPELVGTLVFVQRDNKVLLIHKKTGHGAGKINGPGGKVEADETPYQGALRELAEEVGLTAQRLIERARIKFIELDGPQWFGHVYTNTDAIGDPIETAEARPQWYSRDNLPLAQMWPDDTLWLPQVLRGEHLHAEFLFHDSNLLAGTVTPAASWQLGEKDEER